MTTGNREHTQEEWGLPPGYSVHLDTSRYGQRYDLIGPGRRPTLESVSFRFSFPVARRRLQEKAKYHALLERERREREAGPLLLEACRMALAALETPEARHVLAFTQEREQLRLAIAAVEGEAQS